MFAIQPTSPAKFCDECGAPYLRETSKFCSECGVKRLGTWHDLYVYLLSQRYTHDSSLIRLKKFKYVCVYIYQHFFSFCRLYHLVIIDSIRDVWKHTNIMSIWLEVKKLLQAIPIYTTTVHLVWVCITFLLGSRPYIFKIIICVMVHEFSFYTVSWPLIDRSLFCRGNAVNLLPQCIDDCLWLFSSLHSSTIHLSYQK